jgi:hypothetical protein
VVDNESLTLIGRVTADAQDHLHATASSKAPPRSVVDISRCIAAQRIAIRNLPRNARRGNCTHTRIVGYQPDTVQGASIKPLSSLVFYWGVS